MPAKKYKDLYEYEKKEVNQPTKEENEKAKEAIAKLNELIGEKLKDPKMAKKASEIIAQMLKSK
jgi:uncharacterized membrane protein